MNNPLIISTGAYDGYDFDTIFNEVAALGVKYVELAFIEGYTTPFSEDVFTSQYAKELCLKMEAKGLSCHSFSAHMDLGREDAVEVFSRRMRFAKMVGAGFIVTNAAVEDARDQFMTNIMPIAKLAEELDIMVGLENPGDGRPNVLDTGAKGIALIREINSSHVKVNYDPGNMISHCFEKVRPEEDYKLILSETVHFHVKDVAANDNGWHFTEVGKGEIDYKAILEKVIQLDRVVPLSLEIPLRLQRGKDALPIKAEELVPLDEIRPILQGSVDFMKGLIAVNSK